MPGWANLITLHHLLTHTSGIKEIYASRLYFKNNGEFRIVINHVRALHEYSKLSIAGYDDISCTDPCELNVKNFEIQSYIGLLNKFNQYHLHITCKAGKDRTSMYFAKAIAKEIIYLHVKV